MISIWLFIGISLLVNGALICAVGIYQIATSAPPDLIPAIYNLHANAWWGGCLFLLGIFFCIHFRPGKHA